MRNIKGRTAHKLLGVLAASLSFSGLAASHAAYASGSTPPWEQDPQAQPPYANITFYDSSGNLVRGGTNLSHLFDYAEGTTAADSGAINATLFFAAPNHSLPTSGWYVAQTSGSTAFPVSSPSSLAGSPNPVVTLGPTDADLTSFLGGAQLDTTAGYQYIIQVRLQDSGFSGGSAPNYWDADIAYNPTASSITEYGVTVAPGAWAQVYPTPPAAATTTTLASSANPSVSGQTVTYTATVSPSPDGGTVAFSDNGSPIGNCATQAVFGGQATCAVTYPGVASSPHSIVATYSGDTNFATSKSATLSQTVNAAATSTHLTSSADPAGVNQSVTLTAAVAAVSPGSGTPSGTVDFQDGGSSITGCASQTLTNGTATCATSFTSTGSQSLTAVYTPGTSDFTTSTSSTLNLAVNPATTTSLQTSGTPSVYGEHVTFTATVTVVSPGTGVPDGTVTFSYPSGSGVVTICSDDALTAGTSSSTATCQTGGLPVGTENVTAAYSGSSSYGASTSSAVAQTVTKADTTTTVTGGTPDPAVFGQPVTYTASVTATAPGAGTPTGSVQFLDGSTVLCAAAPLSAGTATCTSSAAAEGTDAITATDGGDSNFNGSTTASPYNETVNPASTTTALKSSANPVVTGQPVTYTATVAVAAPGHGTPGGTVAFTDGGTGIQGCAAQPLSSGQATCQVTYTAAQAGVHTITASFTSSSTDFSGSTSGALSESAVAPTAPSAPGGLTAAAGDGQVTLTWKVPASNGHSAIQGYDVYVGTSSGGESTTPVNGSLIPGTRYTVKGLTNKTRYYFTVEAVNAVGSSSPSNEASATPLKPAGYWLVGSDGGIFGFGGAGFFGSLGGRHLASPIVAMAHTAGRDGYWLVGSDGGVFSFGKAGFFGSLGAVHLTQPIVGIVPTPTGKGYWLVARDGGVFAFGDAHFFGSLGGVKLTAPIVSMASTSDGKGYWLVGSDGGLFAFGHAAFHGSLGGVSLDAPVVGMVTSPDGGGYLLVGSDGGLFAFGDAHFEGSLGGVKLARPIVAVITNSDDAGYWMVGDDGGIFAFGSSRYQGSLPGLGVSVTNIVGGA